MIFNRIAEAISSVKVIKIKQLRMLSGDLDYHKYKWSQKITQCWAGDILWDTLYELIIGHWRDLN